MGMFSLDYMAWLWHVDGLLYTLSDVEIGMIPMLYALCIMHYV